MIVYGCNMKDISRGVISALLLVGVWLCMVCFLPQEGSAADSSLEIGVRLRWTAPGDDGLYGTAAAYDIRYSLSNITDANWRNAVQISDEPRPMPAGSKQSCYISGLVEGNRYYFAVKAVDEAGNWSLLSNCVLKVAQKAICGDVNGDGQVDVGDIVFLLNYVYNGGVAPVPLQLGDVNCDGHVDFADAVYLVKYDFKNGMAPCCWQTGG